MTLQIKKMKRVKAKTRIKWWKLKKEELCSVFRRGVEAGSVWQGRVTRRLGKHS